MLGPQDSMTEETVFSVSELNQMVKDLLEDSLPTVWIRGEVSNLSRPSSGHMYFTLKDNNAQIRCAFFANRHRHLSVQLEEGAQIIALAQVTLYAPRGDYQLIVEQVIPQGEGLLRLAFEQLKQKLSQEGLFDERFKKVLPKFPKQIGVITSPTGAAIRDILSVLKRRFPAIPVVIYPAVVQGNEAPASLIRALEMANARKECDVLILARGGGSLEDLSAFNQEDLARTIFSSELPVVSGVGHEIDFTIADFVADVRAATPSAAAELVSPDRQAYSNDLRQCAQYLHQSAIHHLKHAAHEVLQWEQRLKHPQKLLWEWSQRFDEWMGKIEACFGALWRDKQQRWLSVHHELLSNKLEDEVNAKTWAVQNLFYRLQQGLSVRYDNMEASFLRLAGLLEAVSPLKTLARGYAVVRDANNRVLRSAEQVEVGEEVVVDLSQGRLLARVDAISQR